MPRPRALARAFVMLLAACQPPAPPCRHLCKPSHWQSLDRLAGQPGGIGHTDGPFADAHFQEPWQLVCDGHGKAYLTEDGSNAIREIDLDKGVVGTLAGSAHAIGAGDGIGDQATFFGPSGLTLHGGKLYVADVEHHYLRVIDLATRRVSTIAGPAGHGFKDGPLAQAEFNEPEGLASDGDNIYVGDTDNNMVRKVAMTSGMVSSLAGAARQQGLVDGIGNKARFHKPMQVAADGQGHVYVADTLNISVRVIRISDGSVTTLAKLPAMPLALTVDGDDLLVGCGDNRVVRIDRKSGVVRDWLGAAGEGGFVDGTGKDARFMRPAGTCVDGKGHVIIADSGNHAIRIADEKSGAVTTLAGPRTSGSADGSAADARFTQPRGLAWDPAGAYYVADTGNSTIRRVDGKTGAVTTLAGVAGQSGAQDGRGEAARFNHPQGIALDGKGHVIIADSGNQSLRSLDPATREVTTLTIAPDRNQRLLLPTGIIADGAGVFVADFDADQIVRLDLPSHRLTRIAGAFMTVGNVDGPGDKARFNHPQSIAGDGRSLYIADTGNNAIRKVALLTHKVTTLISNARPQLFGNSIGFNYPSHVAVNGLGDVFVTDGYNNVIRKLDAGGKLGVVLGDMTQAGVLLGPLPGQLYHAGALALDDDGRLALVTEDAVVIAH